MRRLHLVVFALLFGLPCAALGQSLAELAKQEEARRKAIAKPAKIYTNSDLKRDITEPPPPPPPADPAAAPPTAAPTPSTQVPSVNLPAGKAEPAAAPPERDQAYWSARINAARAALERSRIFADALQSRINALTTDVVNRDDPAQRSQLELERQRAVAELERVKKEITDQTKAIADIETEARKAGVPPGWLR